ncbi:MAG: serine/threonine protein kinase [Pirellulales bacterium]|nr:serine/threonine protein kinase [Pirellulales bacterium]
MNCGRFRLLHHIRTGRNTQVWEAIDDEDRKKYAVKLVRQDHVDKTVSEMIRREFTVGHKLDHPRVIRYVESGKFRNFPFLAMDFFGYPNLKVLILQEHEALALLTSKIIEQCVECLQYLQKVDYVHRDIKPENILVSPEGDIKLIDFALAQKPQKVSALASLFGGKKGKVQGTPSYIPPEQIRVQSIDSKADVYSMGCTFFELVAAKLPFTGFNTQELLMKHLRASIPNLEAFNKNVTSDFSGLVREMMAKKPEDRPSVAALAQAVKVISVFKRTPKPAAATAKD